MKKIGTYLLLALALSLAALPLSACGEKPVTTPTEASTIAAAQTEAGKSSETATPPLKEQAEGKYKDGEYEGVGVGYSGGLKVRVTVTGGRIAKVEVLSHNEVGKQYYEAAIRDVPGIIVQKQGTEGIDAVSGSTMTAKGILRAVDKALRKAKK